MSADLRPLRRHDPPARRRGADRHRAVGPGHGAAGERRPAPRRLVPRLPQPPHRGDRPRRRRRATSPRASRSLDGEPFVIHPGEFVLGRTAGVRRAARTTSSRASRARARLGRLGLIVHATAGFVRPGFDGHADARDHEPHARADRAVARPADRAALVHDARPPRRAAVRPPGARQPLPRARSRPPRAATRAAPRARLRPAERSGSFSAHGARVPGARRRRGGEERDPLLRPRLRLRRLGGHRRLARSAVASPSAGEDGPDATRSSASRCGLAVG